MREGEKREVGNVLFEEERDTGFESKVKEA